MPQIFKALSSITVWVLFILGWLGVLATIAYAISIITVLFVIPNVTSLMIGGVFVGGVGCFILSVCVMKLRQMLE